MNNNKTVLQWGWETRNVSCPKARAQWTLHCNTIQSIRTPQGNIKSLESLQREKSATCHPQCSPRPHFPSGSYPWPSIPCKMQSPGEACLALASVCLALPLFRCDLGIRLTDSGSILAAPPFPLDLTLEASVGPRLPSWVCHALQPSPAHPGSPARWSPRLGSGCSFSPLA